MSRKGDQPPKSLVQSNHGLCFGDWTKLVTVKTGRVELALWLEC